eukprot:2858504-Amphidinium_carterae.2
MAMMSIVNKICRMGRLEHKHKEQDAQEGHGVNLALDAGRIHELGFLSTEVLRERVERKGSQLGSSAAIELMTTWLSQQGIIATERQVKYLRDLARKRSTRVSSDMLVSKQAAR